MAVSNEATPKRVFMGKLQHGADLLGELTAVAKEHGVRLGKVEALGALKKARLGFYNQATRTYEFHTMDEGLEITNLVGNVSLKDGEPICHVHVTLSDQDGRAFGGHLAEGAIIFACEFVMTELEGPDYNRGFDNETGLPLWQM